MISPARLSITWSRPDLQNERWEFFHHPDKQSFYRDHAISWELLGVAFEAACLSPYPRGERIDEVPVRFAHHTYDDYLRYVVSAKRGYRLGYARMEQELQRLGHLTLPSPIIISCREEALLFSGYRRLCLAWNYGMVPGVWLVRIE